MSISKRVRVYNGFDRLPHIYSDLFRDGLLTDFELGREWFEHLAGTGLQASDELVLTGLEVDEGSKALALLPLYRPGGGQHLQALATFYSSLFRPLTERGKEADSLEALFYFLGRAPEGYSTLKLFPLSYNETIYSDCVMALQRAGWSAFEYFSFGNWYLPVEGRDYDAYWLTLPSRLRNTIVRKRKRFYGKHHGRIEIVTGGEELEDAVAAYQKIYAASWKKPEPYPDFIPGLVRMLAASGGLRLGVAYAGDEAVAAQIWVVNHGKASIFKLAYDQAYSELSAGSILTAHLMQHVIDVDKVREVDYLTGDDAYKAEWMSLRRERWGIIAYNPRTLAGKIGRILEGGKQYLKRLYQGEARRHGVSEI